MLPSFDWFSWLLFELEFVFWLLLVFCGLLFIGLFGVVGSSVSEGVFGISTSSLFDGLGVVLPPTSIISSLFGLSGTGLELGAYIA